ncbi:unnamed protein product [Cylicocyclus nassatus]|uniref:Apple domain-containing protein n=1 Tax=Cylicocyclus nassatus TaxID=53992 RepID=A0AA36DSN5_CYLNA|nr:unnamed protein product [Cylicocyclus nassatus]
MFLKLTFALCLFHKQAHAVRDVTYTLVTDSFAARILYQRSINNEELCLNICYDHHMCKFVHYSEDNCTVYESGTILYLPVANTYELDRTLTLPSCSREVLLRPTVEFKPIEVPLKEGVTCSGFPSKLTTIHTYLPNKMKVPLYSISDLMGNFTEVQRLYFASEPQSQCVSVPVFTGASHSRLYFGDVYNTTGYSWMRMPSLESAHVRLALAAEIWRSTNTCILTCPCLCMVIPTLVPTRNLKSGVH